VFFLVFYTAAAFAALCQQEWAMAEFWFAWTGLFAILSERVHRNG
jgi:hypothetical protein